MSIRDKDRIPTKVFELFQKVAKRKSQDIKRGIDSPGCLFPSIRHEISNDDLRGDLKKLGKISITPFGPHTPEAEQQLSRYFLKHFQRWLLGKNLPQKRVRPKHERDEFLAADKPKKVVIDGKQITHRLIDDLVFKETENIVDDKKFMRQDKMARKRLIQAKYRYPKPPPPRK